MKGIRDLSGIKESLLTLKAILFVCGSSTFLVVELVKTINRLNDFDTFEDLCTEVRIEVLTAVRFLTEEMLDYYRCMGEVGPDDPAYEFISQKLDIAEQQLNEIKKFL